MNSERIKEIQEQTAYPESRSVHQALLQVWNECEQERNKETEFTKRAVKFYLNELNKSKEDYFNTI